MYLEPTTPFAEVAVRDVFVGDDLTIVISGFPWTKPKPDLRKVTPATVKLVLAILLGDDEQIRVLLPEAGYGG